MGAERPLGAVLTAAGRSIRMGRWKPLLPVGGVPLLETGIRALRAGGVQRIYVVTGHRAEELRPLLARLGAEEVHNPDYARTDMFASVRLGLERAAQDCGAVFLLPGDVALFRSHSVRTMEQLRRARGAELVIPRFRGERGHPVLLSPACIAHALAWSGAGGLRGALDAFSGPREHADLPDPGLLLDADTPADFQRLLDYRRVRGIPNRALCMDLLAWAGTPPEVVRHCEAVARTALALAEAVNAEGGRLSTRLVLAGALLHDIAKKSPRHDRAGAELLRMLDCPAPAAIVQAHMTLPPGAADRLDARSLVYYADKITWGTRRVALADRFAGLEARFAGAPAALAAARRRYADARRVEDRIRQAGGFPQSTPQLHGPPSWLAQPVPPT